MLSTFTVTSAGDSGPGTLRDAIDQSNAGSGPNLIDFKILPAGIQTIDLASPLPYLTTPVAIDGTSEPGYSAANAPVIVLDGTNASAVGSAGLFLAPGSDGSTIEGLAIRNFGDDEPGIDVQLTDNTVQASYLDSDSYGITVQNFNNTIGGASAGQGDVIFGAVAAGILIIPGPSISGTSGPGNVVLGNKIGTNPTGTAADPNSIGLEISNFPDNSIGGTSSGDANLISGNIDEQVYLQGAATTGTVIAGNKIGTDISGTLALAYSLGVLLFDASESTIGGAAPARGT